MKRCSARASGSARYVLATRYPNTSGKCRARPRCPSPRHPRRASAVVQQFHCAVQDKVNDLLPEGIVSVCEVSAARVKGQCALHPRAWNMLSCTGSQGESVKRVFSSIEGLVIWPLTVRLSAVFETAQLPARVALKCEHVVTSHLWS